MVDFQVLLSRIFFAIALCALLPSCLLFSTVHVPCESNAACEDNQLCVDGRCGFGRDGGQFGADGGGDVDGGLRDAGRATDGGENLDGGQTLDGGPIDAGRDAGNDAGVEVDAGPVEPLGVFPTGWVNLQIQSGPANLRCLESGRQPRDLATTGDCDEALTTQWRAVETAAGRYTLHVRYQGSHRCLDGNARNDSTAVVASCRPLPDQIWRLVEVETIENTFYLKNDAGEGCLSRSGPGLRMVSCADGETDQQWRVEPLADGGCPTIACQANEICDFINGACKDDAKEQYCFDGIDEDGNGRADCADDACVDRGECFSAVTLPDPSFEDINEHADIPDTATGWTCNGGLGGCGTETAFVNPGGGYFSEPTDGARYHFLNLQGFGGPNPSFTESNPDEIGSVEAGIYWMEVGIGRRLNGHTTNNRIDIEFLAASQTFAITPVINPQQFAPGSWNDVDAAAIVLRGQNAVGRDFRLRFAAHQGNSGEQAQIDHVRLQHSPLGELVLPHGSFEGPIDEVAGVDGWESLSGAQFYRSAALPSGIQPFDGDAMLRLVKPNGLATVGLDQVLGEQGLPPAVAEDGVYAVSARLSRGNAVPASAAVTLRLFQIGVGPVVTATLDLGDPDLSSDGWVTLAGAKTLRVDDISTAGELLVQILFSGDPAESTIYVDDIRTYFVPMP